MTQIKSILIQEETLNLRSKQTSPKRIATVQMSISNTETMNFKKMNTRYTALLITTVIKKSTKESLATKTITNRTMRAH